MKKIYTREFSFHNDPYFPEQDYILITTSPNEDEMEAFINFFYTNNQSIYCYKDGFIIPQSVFNNILKPLFDIVTKECVIHDREGGEN